MVIDVKRILYPTDFSGLSLHALPYARDLAEMFSAELHCLFVKDETHPIDVFTLMEPFAAKHLSDMGVPVVTNVAEGTPFVEIVRYAREYDCDVIVMGTHGYTGLRHLLIGSTAENVVRHAGCPVFTVRGKEHDYVVP